MTKSFRSKMQNELQIKRSKEHNFSLFEKLNDEEYANEYGILEKTARELRRKHAPHTIVNFKKRSKKSKPNEIQNVDVIYHGLRCKKNGCNCEIGKLASNIYFKFYHRDVYVPNKVIDNYAKLFLAMYNDDKSYQHKNFYAFLRKYHDEVIGAKMNSIDTITTIEMPTT